MYAQSEKIELGGRWVHLVRTLIFFIATTPCLAAGPIVMKIQVVDTIASEKHVSHYVQGTSSHSNTNCNSNATAVGYGNSASANGTTDCTTTQLPELQAMSLKETFHR